MPYAGAVLLVTDSADPESLVRTLVPFRVVLATVVPASLTVRGVTVMKTVAVEVSPEESVAV